MAVRFLTLLCFGLHLASQASGAPFPQDTTGATDTSVAAGKPVYRTGGASNSSPDTTGASSSDTSSGDSTTGTTQTSSGTATTKSGSTSCSGGVTYTVVPSDTCLSISKNAQVSTRTLIGVNSIPPQCDMLHPGDTLCLPPPCGAHVVVSGDTCAALAAQQANQFKGYSVATIQKLNPCVLPFPCCEVRRG